MWCLQPYHPSPAPFPPGRPGALWHPGNCSIPGMQLVGMWEPRELPRWLCVFLFHLHCLISLCLVYAEFIDLKCKIILGIVLSQAGANSLCLWLPIYSLLELIVSMEQLNKLKREWINVWVLVVKGSSEFTPGCRCSSRLVYSQLSGWVHQKMFCHRLEKGSTEGAVPWVGIFLNP